MCVHLYTPTTCEYMYFGFSEYLDVYTNPFFQQKGKSGFNGFFSTHDTLRPSIFVAGRKKMGITTVQRKVEVSRMQFLLFVIWTFKISLLEGLIWTTKPPPINKCVGNDVTFMWTFEKEASEDIRQLQFLVNSTKLIAYKSLRNGFYVDPEYEGRVEASSETGIVLKNISAKDTGNYTLYPIIAREESPNIQSIWLNVIATTMPQWCTCERLPLSTEWSSGQTFSIVAAGCHLEINSSFCCPKGPAIEYCENDPQKLCVPIRNPFTITESTTQSRGPNYLSESTSQTNDKKDPTDVKEEHTQLHLLVANTSMTIYLVIYSLVLLLWKICNQYKHGWKNHKGISKPFL